MANRVKAQPRLVTCAGCRHFSFDTQGPNYNNETHVYFMGVSDIGCDPDKTFNKQSGVAKIFANRLRVCPRWRGR